MPEPFRSVRGRWRARILTVAWIVMVIFVSGCWDRRELESMAFVTALGIDKEGNRYKVTAIIAVPGALAGSGGGGGSSGRSGGGGSGAGGPVLPLTSTGRTLADAFDLMDKRLSRRVTFLQTQLVVLGEAVAREGVSRHFDLLTRYREFTRTFLVAVAEGDAETFLQLQPVIDKDPVKFVIGLIEETAKWGGPPVVRVNEFLLRSESYGGESVAPLLKRAPENPEEHTHPGAGGGDQGSKGGGKSGGSKKPQGSGGDAKPEEGGAGMTSPGEEVGLAVFRGDKMVEKLDAKETLYYLIGSGRMEAATHIVPAPGNPGHWVNVILRRGATKTRVGWRNGRPLIRLTIGLHSDLFGTQARRSPISPRYKEQLMKELRRDITLGIQRVVKKTQRQKADIFNWGDYYRTRCATWPEFVALNWREKYASAIVEISATVGIPRGGAALEPPPSH